MLKNKYYAKKVTIDGRTFDSKIEGSYYSKHLKPLIEAGEVTEVKFQVPYLLQDKFRHKSCKRVQMPIKYVADFVVTYKDGHEEVVDVKGFRTKEYGIKKKLLLYQNPEIDFKEVTKV